MGRECGKTLPAFVYMQDLKFHELANIFPLLEGKQLQELANDIKVNGLRELIVLFEGKILDGRNRYNGLKLAGLDPLEHKCLQYCREFKQYDGDPVAFVISQNIHRRHLTDDQRAQIAAELYEKLPKRKEGGDKKSLSAIADSDKQPPSADDQKQKVATQLKVSTTKVERAAAIKNKDPQKAAEIKAGTKTMVQAEKEIRVPKKHDRAEEVVTMFDGGATQAEIAETTGVGSRQVRHIIDREKYERGVLPTISRDDLSLTSQQKLDLAIKQHKHNLAITFHNMVQAEVNKRLKEYLQNITPKLEAEKAEAQRIIKARRGLMTGRVFRKIQACLHPDRGLLNRDDEGLKKIYEEAFSLFSKLKRLVLDEKECPTPVDDKTPPMPKTWEEWEAVRRKVQAENAAKRQAKKMEKSGVSKNQEIL
jgi:hypothetical protein